MAFDLKKALPHIIAVVLFWSLAAVYYYPALQGYRVVQSDISQHKGMSSELRAHKDIFKEDPLWQGNMFAGMPTYQTSRVDYKGNIFAYFHSITNDLMPMPISMTFFYMLGFYLLMLCIGLNPWLSVFGAIAFGFSSYFFIIIEAGHNSKAFAIGFMAPVLGGVILAYRKNALLGMLIVAISMAIEIFVNHLQVTYYLGFLIVAVGIYYLIKYIKEGESARFVKRSGLLLVGFVIAILANIGNLLTTYEYAKHSTRGKSTLSIKPPNQNDDRIAKEGLDRDYITRWSYGKEETLSLLIADVKGKGSGAIIGDEQEVERLRREQPAFFNYLVQEYQQKGNIVNTYWGNQPVTSGNVYVGAVIFLLAFLAMIFVNNTLKWPLFIVLILSILLAWGKNLMWFTDWFIDYFPMYNKFRAVTIIMVIVELIFPLLAALFLVEVIKRQDEFAAKLSSFYKVSGVFLGLLTLLTFTPETFLDFTSDKEEIVFSQQVSQVGASTVNLQRQQLIDYRVEIFQTSAFKSLGYVLISILLLVLFIKKKINWKTLVVTLTALTLIDLYINNKRFINNDKNSNGAGFVMWDKKDNVTTPYAAGAVDQEILRRELSLNPNLQNEINRITQLRQQEEGRLTKGEMEHIMYTTLMRETHYRVLNTSARLDGDARTAYFHKTLGGYHGAKMKKYQELVDFHLGKEQYALQQAIAQGGQALASQYLPQMNVTNMLNAKYVIGVANTDQGQRQVIIENPNALGNAWFISEVKPVANSDSAILKLSEIDLERTAIINDSEGVDRRTFSVTQQDQITLVDYLPNKLVYNYNATSDQFAVFSEIYYDKGWKAYINDKEIEIHEVNFLLRGVAIPSGSGELVMVFEPSSYAIGSIMAYITSLLVIGLIVFYLVRKKKTLSKSTNIN
jgi:hypothetical protein